MTPTTRSKEPNAPGGSSIHTSSKVNLSYTNADTYKFGLIQPCQVSDVVPRDQKYRLHSGHDCRSYTLKAPLMQNINMYKTHFAVPMQAILPLNWNKFFDAPVIGEDVPDDAGCGVENFAYRWYQKLSSLASEVESQALDDASLTVSMAGIRDLFLFYSYGKKVFSNGSLLSQLGARYSKALIFFAPDADKANLSFDRFFEIYFANFCNYVKSFRVVLPGNSELYSTEIVCSQNSDGSFDNDMHYSDAGYIVQMSFRQFLDYLGDEFPTTFLSITFSDSHTVGQLWIELLTNIMNTASQDYENLNDFITFKYYNLSESDRAPLNIARLWAYQLVCAHFYTNDKVDYVFSAELFRQLIGSYIDDVLGFFTFSVNGITYQYDYLSTAYFNAFMNVGNFSAYPYFTALFEHKHSLKFMDYFTGSRTRPLAVGDVSYNVENNQVNVVDFAHSTWAAKFKDAVNRYGADAKNYVRGIFGIKMAYDYHDPMYLGQTRDVIYSVETDNTGEAQLTTAMSTTAQFRSNGDRFAFDFDADRNCILLSLVHFDIDRLYTTTVDRQMLVVDRFDYFNPFTQFLGDQPIYKEELNGGAGLAPFSYTGRDMQYKQRYGVANGGFIEFLPGWAFLADENSPTDLTPRFIRSYPYELDRFYVSLVHLTDAGYFHFIVKNRNTITAVRPMALKPHLAY